MTAFENIETELEKLQKEADDSMKAAADLAAATTLKAYKQIDIRDGYYTQLLKQFTENHKRTHKTRRTFKWIFFSIVCLSFVGVVTAGIYVIIVITQKKPIEASDVAVAITGLGSVLSAIIVLPKIIAKHLFPEDGDVKEFSFVRNMLNFDTGPGYSYSDYVDEEENIAAADEFENT